GAQPLAMAEARYEVYVGAENAAIVFSDDRLVIAYGGGLAVEGIRPHQRPGALAEVLPGEDRHAVEREGVDRAPILALDDVEGAEGESDVPAHHLLPQREVLAEERAVVEQLVDEQRAHRPRRAIDGEAQAAHRGEPLVAGARHHFTRTLLAAAADQVGGGIEWA